MTTPDRSAPSGVVPASSDGPLPTASTSRDGLPPASSTSHDGLPPASSTSHDGLPPASSTSRDGLPPAALRALAEAEARRAAPQPATPPELRGRGGLEPVRYGDWEVKGLASDF